MTILDTEGICVIHYAAVVQYFSVVSCGIKLWVTPCQCTASNQACYFMMRQFDDHCLLLMLPVTIVALAVFTHLRSRDFQDIWGNRAQSACISHNVNSNPEHCGNRPSPGLKIPQHAKQTGHQINRSQERFLFDKPETSPQYWHD